MNNKEYTPKGKCPHCNGEVTLATIKKETQGVGFIKQEIMYLCPHCHKVLGFSTGRMI